jgi:hypothetical protein
MQLFSILGKEWRYQLMNEEYKQFETVSDSKVIEVASKLMNEFNEAFEELAK